LMTIIFKMLTYKFIKVARIPDNIVLSDRGSFR